MTSQRIRLSSAALAAIAAVSIAGGAGTASADPNDPVPAPPVPADPASVDAAASAAAAAAAGTPAVPGAVAIPGSTGIGAVSPASLDCELGWPKPKLSGGLASIILLAPLAGAFTDEGFAAGQAYDPIMQLAGPFLAALEPSITAAAPGLAPIVDVVNAAEQGVLDAILPVYGPYRADLIDSLVQFGNDVTPFLQAISTSPAAVCLVAWEGAVVEGAQTGNYAPFVFTGLPELAALASTQAPITAPSVTDPAGPDPAGTDPVVADPAGTDPAAAVPGPVDPAGTAPQ